MFEPKNTENLSFEEQFKLLMDERNIRNVLDRYSRAASRADLELYKSCFHDDAVLRSGPTFQGSISDFYEKFHETADKTCKVGQYYLTNVLMDIDGDVAHTETEAFSAKILHEVDYNGDEVMRLAGFRYLHRFERRNGEWRISVAWFVSDWGFFGTIPQQMKNIGVFATAAERAKNNAFVPKRNSDDISYKFGSMGL